MEGGFSPSPSPAAALAEAAEHLEQGKAQLLGRMGEEPLAEELPRAAV